MFPELIHVDFAQLSGVNIHDMASLALDPTADTLCDRYLGIFTFRSKSPHATRWPSTYPISCNTTMLSVVN